MKANYSDVEIAILKILFDNRLCRYCKRYTLNEGHNDVVDGTCTEFGDIYLCKTQCVDFILNTKNTSFEMRDAQHKLDSIMNVIRRSS